MNYANYTGNVLIGWLVLSAVLVLLGILAWFLTYLIAPRASIKSGHYVSGIPLTGAVLVALGFLLSPLKWLALSALLEFLFMFMLSRTAGKQDQDPLD